MWIIVTYLAIMVYIFWLMLNVLDHHFPAMLHVTLKKSAVEVAKVPLKVTGCNAPT